MVGRDNQIKEVKRELLGRVLYVKYLKWIPHDSKSIEFFCLIRELEKECLSMRLLDISLNISYDISL